MKQSLKSTVVLVCICAVMAVMLALTNAITAPVIEKNQASAANAALLQVARAFIRNHAGCRRGFRCFPVFLRHPSQGCFIGIRQDDAPPPSMMLPLPGRTRTSGGSALFFRRAAEPARGFPASCAASGRPSRVFPPRRTPVPPDSGGPGFPPGRCRLSRPGGRAAGKSR